MSDNKEFVRSISNATFKIITDMTKNMNKACLVIEADAKKNCPVDQGILRASITHGVAVTADEITGTVGSNLEYAPCVHNGTGIYAKDGNGRKTPWGYTAEKGKYKGYHQTRGQQANPFLENAKLQNKNRIAKILGGE